MRDQEIASFISALNPIDGRFYKLRPYQHAFIAKSRRAQDVWSLNISFFALQGIKEYMSSFQLEDVKRDNKALGIDKTPIIKVIEYKLINGTPTKVLRIDDSLQSANVKFIKYNL